LRATLEIDARAPLPAQPPDLGYFAQAVEVIRGSPSGRAMLRTVVVRAELRRQVEARAPEAAPGMHMLTPAPSPI
jgi:hypothetical protein